MPSKKKKYNARFPAGRIKKIMQTDEEVGKVAQAVPVIISRTLELFVESLLTKSMHITLSRNAKTLTPSHMKQCILSESRFDFLKDLVKNVPDASTQEDNENNALFEAGPEPETSTSIAPPTTSVTITTPGASTSRREKRKERLSSNMGSSSKQPEFSIETNPPQIERQPVIQFVPKQSKEEPPKLSFSVSSMLPDVASSSSSGSESNLQIRIDASSSGHLSNINSSIRDVIASNSSSTNQIPVPPLVPLSNTFYNSNTSDTLCIDEDYDN